MYKSLERIDYFVKVFLNGIKVFWEGWKYIIEYELGKSNYVVIENKN